MNGLISIIYSSNDANPSASSSSTSTIGVPILKTASRSISRNHPFGLCTTRLTTQSIYYSSSSSSANANTGRSISSSNPFGLGATRMVFPAAQTISTSLAYEQFVLLKETNIGEEKAFKSAVANMSIEEFFSIKANRGEKEIELNRQFQCVAANMGSLVIPDKAFYMLFYMLLNEFNFSQIFC